MTHPRYWFLFLLPGWLMLFGSLPAQAQSGHYRLLSTLPGAVSFTTDKLQHVYLVTPDNTVLKYGPDGRLLFDYNNNTLGRLAHIDATNPFNLLLYYPDFQTALTLDRTLNKIGEFNLWNLPVTEAGPVAMAADNGLWIFDNGAFRLLNVDQNGELRRQSDNLSLLLNATPQPAFLVFRDNFVYAADPALGILVFDNFAQYVRTYRVENVRAVQVLGRQLLYRRGDGVFVVYDLQTFDERPLPLPANVEDIRQVRIQKDRLYVLHGGGLSIYLIL